jgi:hypothetical protein
MRTKSLAVGIPIRGQGDFESKDKLNTEGNGKQRKLTGIIPSVPDWDLDDCPSR